jgi:HEAT repeat protein
VMGGRDELWELYRGETSRDVKKTILHSLFIAGAAERLQEVLGTEQDPEMRRAAIHSLGLMGGRTAALMASMYQSERDQETRKHILNAMFLQNNAAGLVQVARSEKDPELRKAAVHWLSLMRNPEATRFLMELLNK